MGDKLNKILEGYKPIPMKRMFYPRGMKLSEDFVNAFHREYDRLVGEGVNPKSLVERFGKAMRFHQNEDRRYIKLDEEKAKLEEARGRADTSPAIPPETEYEKSAGEHARRMSRKAQKKALTKDGVEKQTARSAKAAAARKGGRERMKPHELEEGKKKKKSRKKGGTYGMGDSHSDSDGGDD